MRILVLAAPIYCRNPSRRSSIFIILIPKNASCHFVLIRQAFTTHLECIFNVLVEFSFGICLVNFHLRC